MNDIFDILISLLSHWSASPSCPHFISSLCVTLLKKCQWIDRQAFCGEITLICCCDKCSEVLSSSLPVLPHLNSQGHISKALCLSVCLSVSPLSPCLSISLSLAGCSSIIGIWEARQWCCIKSSAHLAAKATIDAEWFPLCCLAIPS